MFGEEFDEDWRIIEKPFNEPKITSTVESLVNQALKRFQNNKDEDMATEKQKRYLMSKKLSYQGDVEKLTREQARKIITRKTRK